MNETYACVSLASDDLVNCILDEIRCSGIGSVGDAAWNKDANLLYLMSSFERSSPTTDLVFPHDPWMCGTPAVLAA